MTETSTRQGWGRRLPVLSARGPVPHPSLASRLLPVGLLLLGAAAQTAIVLDLVQHSWFGVDAVNYLTTRGPVPTADLGLFQPYGGHWQTLPLLLYRGLFATVGLTYLPYVCVSLGIHLAITGVLYALLRTLGTSRWAAAVTAWVVLFFGAGAEAFMVDAPMVLTGSLLLGLVGMLVMARSRFSARSLAVAALLLLASVMCSGTGLTAVVAVAGFVLLRAGPRAALFVGAPAVAAFTVWFVELGHKGGRVHVSASTLPHIPGFVWSGLTGSVGSVLGVPGTGALVLLVLMGVALVVRDVPVALRQLALAGSLGAVAQLVLSSFASLVVGDGAARVGRYEYLVFVLLSPGLAVAAQSVVRLVERGMVPEAWRGLVTLGAVVLLVTATAQGVAAERRQRDFNNAGAALYRTWVYGSVAAADAGERQLVVDADRGFNGGRFELFAAPQLRRRLPAGPETAQNRLDAESEYFVQVGPDDPHLFSPTRLSVQGFSPGFRSRPGCQRLSTDGSATPTIDVETGDGTEIGITGSTTAVSTQLFRRYAPSTPRLWLVPPGEIFVATTARDAVLRITLNGSGSMSVCHR